MIRYTPQSQLTLEGFETPFLQHLDKDNRWVKLANSIPWDKLANIYYRKMNSDFGAPSLSARMVIGAVIIKHMLNIDDREVVAQIQENMYLQYLVGLSSFTTKEPFDPSLLVTIRYRLGQDVMEEFNRLVLQQAGIIPSPSKDTAVHTSSSGNENSSSDTFPDVDENTAKNKKEQSIEPSTNIERNNTTGENITLPANSGTLLVDATVAEQQKGISHRSEVAQ
ncbi:MAG TPA: transposase [Segetibacter sp.]